MRGRRDRQGRRPADDDEGRIRVAEAADFQGMNPSPARRWLRRTASLIVGAPLIMRPPGRSRSPCGSGRGGHESPHRLAHCRCVPGHPRPQRTGRGGHAHRLRHADQQGQEDGHGRGGRPARRAEAVRQRCDRRGRQAHRVSARQRPGQARWLVHAEGPQARVRGQPGLQPLRPGGQAGPGGRRRLPARGVPHGPDHGLRLRPGAGHPADLPAVAAGGQREQDQAHVPLAADRIGPRHRRDGLRRTADPRVRQRRSGSGARSGRPPRTTRLAGATAPCHLGDRPGPAGLRRRDDEELSRQGR